MIGNVAGVQQCVVYGVTVPNVDGRVGMAALLPTEKEPSLSEVTLLR